MLLDKSDKNEIRKRLNEIDRLTSITRTKKTKLLTELSKIKLNLEYKRKHFNFDYGSSDYYGLKDLEYTFGDLDDYYKPILAKESFNGNYQMFTCRGDEDRNMDISKYLDKVRPYLRDLINEKKISDQKIQLDMAINLRHLTKNDRITFYVKSKNIVCLPSDNSEDILEQLFNSLQNYYADKLLICRTSSSYAYESVEGLSIHFHEIDLNRGSSYIPSPDWLKNKGATINPQNTKDNYCFMYALTIALNHQEMGSKPDRISNELINHILKYNWDYIDFSSGHKDYFAFEQNNEDIALNIPYIPYDTEQIRPEYISNYNFDRKNQVTLLEITDNKGTWYFLSLKSIPTKDGFTRPTKSFSRLMHGKSSKSHENCYCYGCFHSFRCQSTLEKHTQLCKDHRYCKINLPEKGKNIKKHKYGTNALRMNDIIYLDLECLLLKYDSCSNNLIQSHTKNDAYHEACGYSTTILRNHSKESTTSYHRGKDCLLKLCKELREKATNLINTEKLTVTPLTHEEQKKHDDSKKCFISNKKFITDKKNKYYKKLMKVKDHDHYTGKYRGATHSICNLRYKTQKDIPVVIYDGSNYDFHLITTELAKNFRSEIHCIPEDKEKYKSFSITLMHKKENNKTIKYNLKFIDSARFMIGSLGTHVNNLSGLFDCNCEDEKKRQIKIKDNDKSVYTRCNTSKKRSKQPINSLKDKFPSTYQLAKGNMDTFIFLLRKGVYPYEYMDSWEKFDETELPSIDKFYSNLNLEDIDKDDYKHAQKVWSTFNIKILGEYHDLYVQSDTTQLADTFE